jgi:hypothetical protein
MRGLAATTLAWRHESLKRPIAEGGAFPGLVGGAFWPMGIGHCLGLGRFVGCCLLYLDARLALCHFIFLETAALVLLSGAAVAGIIPAESVGRFWHGQPLALFLVRLSDLP